MTEKKIKLVSLKASAAAERDGEWIEAIDPQLEGVRFKVRPLHYGPFQLALRQATMRLSRKYPGNAQIPPDEAEIVNGGLYADHLLLDWEGFDEAYSAERSKALLTDIAFRVLRNEIRYCAEVAARAHVEFAETVAGNSAPASDGN